MSLTSSDFPNQAAYDAYTASEKAKAKAAADASAANANKTTPAKTTPAKTTAAGGGGTAASTPVQRVTQIEPVQMVADVVTEDETTDDGLTEYERRLLALETERMRREEEASQFRPREDAEDVIRRVLASYGLESLTSAIWNRYTAQEVNIEDESAIIYSIREEDAYKKRFAANAKRLAAGLPELEPSSYLELEDNYRKVLQNNGMPPGFYDSIDDFQAFIEGDVSVVELQNRVQQGYRLVQDADPMVKAKMRDLYGVGEGELAAYFIDPERARPLLVAADYQRQARAAQIAARAQEQAGITLTGTLAEDLARRGVTAEEAATGFSEIGALGELRQTFAGEQELTQEQLVGAQFGIDTAASQELARRKTRRIAEFTGGGSFARSAGEAAGVTRLGIGTAQ